MQNLLCRIATAMNYPLLSQSNLPIKKPIYSYENTLYSYSNPVRIATRYLSKSSVSSIYRFKIAAPSGPYFNRGSKIRAAALCQPCTTPQSPYSVTPTGSSYIWNKKYSILPPDGSIHQFIYLLFNSENSYIWLAVKISAISWFECCPMVGQDCTTYYSTTLSCKYECPMSVLLLWKIFHCHYQLGLFHLEIRMETKHKNMGGNDKIRQNLSMELSLYYVIILDLLWDLATSALSYVWCIFSITGLKF